MKNLAFIARPHNKAILSLALLVLTGIFLFTGCPTDPDPEDKDKDKDSDFTVKITNVTGGTITADPMKGPAGTEISVLVNPEPGYKYTSGSLKYNTTPIADTGSQPYTFTLNESVTLTAQFEQLPANTFSVTIGSITNGTITADPAYGTAGTLITLTISPNNTYVLKEGSLTYTPAGGGATTITGNTFPLPAAHVTVNAVFEKGNLDSFLSAGISALETGNYDTAISSFESAYQLDKNNQEAIVYSTLGRLAAIAVDDDVKALMTNRLGIKDYPGTINKLISPDWMQEYTDEELVWSYRDGNTWVSWYDKNDSWFFNNYGLTPKAGYYKWQSLNITKLTLISSDRRTGKIYRYYDNILQEWVDWYNYDQYKISTPGYYYYGYDNDTDSWGYILVSSVEKTGELDEYRDTDTGRYYWWRSSNPGSGYTGYTVPGYYWAQNDEYTLVSETPRYEAYTSSLPGLDVPSWFSDTDTYKDSFTATNLKTTTTFTMLLVTNLIEKNTNGLNALLDDLLSSVFGDAFEAAYTRAGTLTENVKLSEDMLEAFGLLDLFEGEVYIGKAELNVLFAALRIFKASLEWVAAYDWNTDLNFLKNGPLWDDWDELKTYKPSGANLPLRNNFLKDRNNGMMPKSKADFIKAIDDTIAAYDLWIGAGSKLPQGYKDTLADYAWAKQGFTQLKTAINGGGNFYLKILDSGATTYANTQQDAVIGINMGKLFTPGQLAIDKLIETTTIAGKGPAPKFYSYDEQNDEVVEITQRSQIRSYGNTVAFKFKLQPIKEIAIYGLGEMPDSEVLPIFAPDFAEYIWDWYNQ